MNQASSGKSVIDPAAILRSIQSILLCVSSDGLILYLNSQAERTFAVPSGSVVGKNIESAVRGMDWKLVFDGMSRCALDGRPVTLPAIEYNATGGLIILGFTIIPLRNEGDRISGFLLNGSDITEKKFLERQLLQSSKMATIGEMATGIAHEMNQPLNIMKIAAQRLNEAVAEGYGTVEFTRERASVIIEQIDRLSGIINHLRVFGRTDAIDFTPLDMRVPIRKAFSLLGEQLKGLAIDVSLYIPEDLPKVAGIEARIEQVFMNLIINSRDAFSDISAGNKKKISVSVRHDDKMGLLAIEFSDTGPGIPLEFVDRVFEPFFTTKVEGKGTGLGLSICAGIISEHGGSIRAEPSASGVRFIIMLPAITNEV